MLIGHVRDKLLDAIKAPVAELAGERLLPTAGIRVLLQVALALVDRGEPLRAQRASVWPGRVHILHVAIERLLRSEVAVAERAHKGGPLVFSPTTPGPVGKTLYLYNIEGWTCHHEPPL